MELILNTNHLGYEQVLDTDIDAIIVGLKNLRFIIQNRNWKKNRDKELLELKNKKSSENVKEI